MSAASIPVPEVQCKLTAPLGQGWAGVLGRMDRSRVHPRGQTVTECFGKLTDKDEMVAKGLSVSFARSIQPRQGGW
jgi:hypothetical protein